ncbi:hypothetical protein L195_g056559, partial [Trifolium pratense]
RFKNFAEKRRLGLRLGIAGCLERFRKKLREEKAGDVMISKVSKLKVFGSKRFSEEFSDVEEEDEQLKEQVWKKSNEERIRLFIEAHVLKMKIIQKGKQQLFQLPVLTSVQIP